MTLPTVLVELSSLTRQAYDVAVDADRLDVAVELEKLGGAIAVLIAKSLRGTLEKAS